jgi:hypothetical protein
MTCSRCASDTTKYPKTSEWGPLVWLILHTLAEKAGKQTNEIIKGDEMRAWPLFLKALIPIIPCEECRAHAGDYIKQIPFELPNSYPAWNFYIRTYFYTFHEAVNTRLEKPSFPFSSLADTYKSTGELTKSIQDLNAMMVRAMKLNGMHMGAWQTWQKHLRMLSAAMGI